MPTVEKTLNFNTARNESESQFICSLNFAHPPNPPGAATALPVFERGCRTLTLSDPTAHWVVCVSARNLPTAWVLWDRLCASIQFSGILTHVRSTCTTHGSATIRCTTWVHVY